MYTHKNYSYIYVIVMALMSGCVSTSTHKIEKDQRFFIGIVKSAENKEGSPVSLSVGSHDAGYLTCFYEDKNNSAMRFFPNRFYKNAYLAGNSVLTLPGDMPFKLTSSANIVEKLACFLTTEDIFLQLPAEIKRADFDTLPYSITMIDQFFKTITQGHYSYVETAL